MTINQYDWYYKYLDLPALPPILEANLWNTFHGADFEQRKYTSDHYLNRRPELAHKPGPGDVHIIRDSVTVPNCRGSRYRIDQCVSDWVDENITSNYVDTGLYIIFGDTQTTVAPHTDQTRNLSLLYLLEPGGNDASTKFWQETGHDVTREMKTFSGDYSRNHHLLTVKWPLRKWVLLNTNILHSVENLTEKRIQFQVSLDVVPNVPALYTKDL